MTRPTVERLASEEPDECPVDGLACHECPSYCLEIYSDDYWTCGGCGHEGNGPDNVGWYEHTKVCVGRVQFPTQAE